MLGIKIKNPKFQYFFFKWVDFSLEKKTKTKDGLNDKVPRH